MIPKIEIKVSLMETVKIPELTEKGKGEFIIRGSAKYSPSEYFEKTYRDLTSNEKANEKLFGRFLGSTLDLIFSELREKTKQEVDAVGIWIDDGSEEPMENSMQLSFFDSMGQYNHDEEEIIPIYELYKMTLGAYKEV